MPTCVCCNVISFFPINKGQWTINYIACLQPTAVSPLGDVQAMPIPPGEPTKQQLLLYLAVSSLVYCYLGLSPLSLLSPYWGIMCPLTRLTESKAECSFTCKGISAYEKDSIPKTSVNGVAACGRIVRLPVRDPTVIRAVLISGILYVVAFLREFYAMKL